MTTSRVLGTALALVALAAAGVPAHSAAVGGSRRLDIAAARGAGGAHRAVCAPWNLVRPGHGSVSGLRRRRGPIPISGAGPPAGATAARPRCRAAPMFPDSAPQRGEGPRTGHVLMKWCGAGRPFDPRSRSMTDVIRSHVEVPAHGGLPARARRLPVGAEIQPGGGVHFRVWAPRAASVDLVLADEAARAVPLEPEPRGYFSGLVPEAAAGTRYRFRLDGETLCARTRPRASSPTGPMARRGRSIRPRFAWTDGAWPGVRPGGAGPVRDAHRHLHGGRHAGGRGDRASFPSWPTWGSPCWR